MDESAFSFMLNRLSRRACVTGAAIAACAAVTPGGTVRAADLLPIWISPALGLGKEVSDPAEAAQKALYQPLEDEFHLILRIGGERKTAVPRDCREIIDMAPNIVGAGSDQEYRVLRAVGVRCRALWFLSRARPAERSFLANFRLDGENLRYLPPAFGFAISPDDQERVRQAEQAGENIFAVDRNVRLVAGEQPGRPGNASAAQLIGETWSAKLSIYARADFTGDGWEDLLIRRDMTTNAGTFAETSLFGVTRHKQGETLQLFWPRGPASQPIPQPPPH